MPSMHESQWLIFGVFFILFSVVAFSRLYYSHLLSERIQAYIATRYLKQLIRKELALYHPYSIITLVLFSTCVGLVVVKAIEIYQPVFIYKTGFFSSIFYVSVITLGWIVARAYLLKIVQFILSVDFGQTENRYRTIIFNQVCGYAVLPIIFIAYFVNGQLQYTLVCVSIALLTVNYAYRIIQSAVTAVNYSANKIYLFLYLCTLEIVPLIWVLTEING